jgi:hypothetical protein
VQAFGSATARGSPISVRSSSARAPHHTRRCWAHPPGPRRDPEASPCARGVVYCTLASPESNSRSLASISRSSRDTASSEGATKRELAMARSRAPGAPAASLPLRPASRAACSSASSCRFSCSARCDGGPASYHHQEWRQAPAESTIGEQCNTRAFDRRAVLGQMLASCHSVVSREVDRAGEA